MGAQEINCIIYYQSIDIFIQISITQTLKRKFSNQSTHQSIHQAKAKMSQYKNANSNRFHTKNKIKQKWNENINFVRIINIVRVLLALFSKSPCMKSAFCIIMFGTHARKNLFIQVTCAKDVTYQQRCAYFSCLCRLACPGRMMIY